MIIICLEACIEINLSSIDILPWNRYVVSVRYSTLTFELDPDSLADISRFSSFTRQSCDRPAIDLQPLKHQWALTIICKPLRSRTRWNHKLTYRKDLLHKNSLMKKASPSQENLSNYMHPHVHHSK